MKHHYQIKKAFISELNLEDSSDEGNTYYKKVFKELGLKGLGNYHDLFVECDTLLLADVFKNFKNKYIKIYEYMISAYPASVF